MVLRAFRPCPYPKHAASASLSSTDMGIWATSPLGVVVRRVFCGVFFFSPPSYVALWDSKTPHRPAGAVWKLLLVYDSLPRTGLGPWIFCLSFYLLYFVLPPFKENGLPFWVSSVLRQCSEVVLRKLPGIQMIFWWIFGGESGLPVLFLCHLRTAPSILSLNMLCTWLLSLKLCLSSSFGLFSAFVFAVFQFRSWLLCCFPVDFLFL